MGRLTELRELCPARRLTPAEAAAVAERQAHKLLKLQGVTEPPVPEQLIEAIPRIIVHWVPRTDHLAGLASWRQGTWHLIVDTSDPWVRQRFSLAHEFKHVLDHPWSQVLYRDRRFLPAEKQAERACEYFAACLLMPKAFVRHAFYDRGIRDAGALARQFVVSQTAMRIRMEQLQLLEPAEVAA